MPEPDHDIPANVRKFILDHVNSVEQLETLLLLHKYPTSEFTALDVSKALYTTEESISKRLTDLETIGVVKAATGPVRRFHYLPKNADIAAAVDGLATAYQTRRVSVITMIFTKGTSNLRAFTDSFKITRDEEER